MSVSKNGVNADTQKTSNAPAVAKPVSIAETKTINRIFERINEATRKRDFFVNFSERLENLKSFTLSKKEKPLIMEIYDPAKREERVEFQNKDLIDLFLASALKRGEEAKEQLQSELLNLSL